MRPDKLRRYDLNLLVTLHVLLEECSVSRAARRLSLSQSAISRSLSRLRDVFGDELFVRRPHGLQPTRRALELQEELAGTLGQVSRLVEPPRFEPSGCSQTFRISLMEHLSVQLLPRLLTYLSRVAPKVRLHLVPWNEESSQAMSTGMLDSSVNIVSLDRPDLYQRRIGPARPVVFITKEHPLALQQRVTMDEFLEYPHISLRFYEYNNHPLMRQLTSMMSRRDVLLTATDIHAALEVVSNTQALMIGTLDLCQPLLERHGLTSVELPSELATLDADYLMTWHRLQHRNPAQEWFRTILYEHCLALDSSRKNNDMHLEQAI